MQRNAAGRKVWLGILVAGMFTVSHRSHSESSQNGVTRVYECRIDGQRVFSDQPCATNAARREVTPVNSMSAREASIDYRSSSSVPTKHKPAPDEPAPHETRQARCARLLNDKSYLTSRLRAGYTNNQGERLRERLRKVDSQYYDLRCSTQR